MSIRFTIHRVTVSYQYMSSLCYCEIHLLRFVFCYHTSIYNKYVILLCFICNHQKNLHISWISKQFFCDIFEHKFLVVDKHIYNIPKASITDTQQTLKDGALAVSEDCGDGYRESDLNCLASVILRQYTMVSNQC